MTPKLPRIVMASLLAGLFFVVASRHLDQARFIGDDLVNEVLAQRAFSAAPAPLGELSHCVRIAGLNLPTGRSCDYDFALPAYLLMPFVYKFGLSIFLAKMQAIVISTLYLAILYATLASLFDGDVAALAVFLIAVDPLFIRFSLKGESRPEPLIDLLCTSSVFLFLRYRRGRGAAHLAASFLLLGAGLSVKLTVLARYIGLAAATLLFLPMKIAPFFRRLGWRRIVLIAVCFAAGSVLFWTYNASTGGRTFSLIRCLTRNEPTWSGGRNFDVAQHTRQRLQQLKEFLADRPEWCCCPRLWRLSAFCSYGSFLGVLILAILGQTPIRRRLILFIYVFFITMFLTTLFSPNQWEFDHLAPLCPFPPLVLALAVVTLLTLRAAPRVGKALGGTLLIFLLFTRTALLGNFLSHRPPGDYTNDEMVRGIVEFIQRRDLAPVVFIDAGVQRAVLYFGARPRVVLDSDLDYTEEETPAILRDFRSKSKDFYVFVAPKGTEADEKWLRVSRYCQARHWKVDSVGQLSRPDSRSSFCDVYRLRAPSERRPQP